jgi:hypothetical protein
MSLRVPDTIVMLLGIIIRLGLGAQQADESSNSASGLAFPVSRAPFQTRSDCLSLAKM